MRLLAERRESYRAYAARRDQWGRGLVPDAVLRGLMGEQGFALWGNRRIGLSLAVDESDLPEGDRGWDFSPFCLRVQVKTRALRGDLLLRRHTERGRIVPIRWHVCVVATWEGGDTVTLDGWVRPHALVSSAVYLPARRGSHDNLELPDDRLQSMHDLAALIDSRRPRPGAR